MGKKEKKNKSVTVEIEKCRDDHGGYYFVSVRCINPDDNLTDDHNQNAVWCASFDRALGYAGMFLSDYEGMMSDVKST